MQSTRRAVLRRLGGGASGVLAGSALSGCASNGSADETVTNVRVGSKPFPEQKILGYLAYERLATVDGLQAVDEIGYGGSLSNWTATASGTKDIYWEYTGTIWSRLPPERDERVTDPVELFDRVKADAREQGLSLGSPAPYSNEWVIVVSREWRERTGITSLSEFGEYVAAGNIGINIAFNEDFYHRPDGWVGVAGHYGIDDDTRANLESGEFVVTSKGLTYELLEEGRVDVGSGFATDPQLARRSVVTLDDDRNYFLPYQPVPTANADRIESHPEIFEVLEPVATAIDERTIRQLNQRVIRDERPPRTVARRFLEGLR